MRQTRDGFSLVGVLVVAGLIGGLSLFLAEMTKRQHVTQKKAETGTEFIQLQHKILTVLYDGDACLATLGAGSVLENNRQIDQLKNRAGSVVVEKGKKINRLLEVDSMVIKNVRGSTGKTREADVVVTIKKISKAITGYDKIVRTYPITVELDALPDKIGRCHHTLNDNEQKIKERMCTEIGGVLIPVSADVSRCSIDNLYRKFCEEMGAIYTAAPAMKCDVTPILQKFCTSLGGIPSGADCDIASVYVDVAGDTMTGDLKATNIMCTNLSCTGNISAGGTVSAEGK